MSNQRGNADQPCDRAVETIRECILSGPLPELPPGCSPQISLCDAECYLRDTQTTCDFILDPARIGDEASAIECADVTAHARSGARGICQYGDGRRIRLGTLQRCRDQSQFCLTYLQASIGSAVS